MPGDRHGIKWTKEQWDKEMLRRQAINDRNIADAHRISGEILLRKLARTVEEGETRRAVDVVLLSAFEMADSESGELLLDAWRDLREGKFIKIAGEYDNFVGGDQADLKRLLEIFGFRRWKRLAEHVQVNGKKINVRSMTSQKPGQGRNSETWNAISLFLEKRGHFGPPISDGA